MEAEKNMYTPMVLNGDYYAVASNELIYARQSMSKREAQLLVIAISQIMAEDDDLRTYKVDAIELAKFLDIHKSELYRTLKTTCKQLLSRVIEMEVVDSTTGKASWKTWQWVNYAEYNDGTLTLRLSDELRPYLLQLTKLYTQSTLTCLLSFNSYYAFRTFQYFKAKSGEKRGYKTHWVVSMEELRELYQLGDIDNKTGKYKKYPNPSDFLKRTIKTSLDEITKSDYAYVSNYEIYREKKGKGRKVCSGVSFNIVFFENLKEKKSYLKTLHELDDEEQDQYM